ncbi:MAG: YkgJ family cysteine cluster protein [Desulfomonilaceae bacterium]|nr:YkgJ family cysteine cluster protein [Desulfomonilaceae bacterium]
MNNNPPPTTTPVNPDKRLSVDDEFQFACGPHVPCFTECCRKLDLLLTPFDVLNLRKVLGISSAEFLDSYCRIRVETAHGFPEILLKMDSGEDRRCPFVTRAGCSIYLNRPGACRIYPLGRASTKHPMDGTRKEFYFTVREDHCRGFDEPCTWRVEDWLSDQGMHEYNKINDLLMELYVYRTRGRRVTLGPSHIQMFMMACYNLDRFRDFIFNSPFLSKFEVPSDAVEELRGDDVRLLEFAFRWLKFALFSEPTMVVRGQRGEPSA